LSERPAEERNVHTRLLKCALEVGDARAYWSCVAPPALRERPAPVARASVDRAFEEYWFGARSRARVHVLLTNFRARFDAFPAALAVLRRWEMSPEVRALVCHWHVQLSDPLYRAFTGRLLVAQRLRGTITREQVVNWVEEQGQSRWTMSTCVQFASKLLSAALSAGLVGTRRDPRPLVLPRVRDVALGYLLHLLREIEFEGTMLDNPYLASVGLMGAGLEDRLGGLPDLQFQRQEDLVEFGWRHDNLAAWARSQPEIAQEVA